MIYYLLYPNSNNYGVTKKVIDKIGYLRSELNLDIEGVFIDSETSNYFYDSDSFVHYYPIHSEDVVPNWMKIKLFWKLRFNRKKKLKYAHLERILRERKCLTVVKRFEMASKPLLDLYKSTNIKFVVEFNSDRRQEFYNSFIKGKSKEESKWSQIELNQEIRFGVKVNELNHTNLSVTQEILEIYEGQIKTSLSNKKVISNGIAVESFPVKKVSLDITEELNIVTVLTANNDFRGLDRFIAGVKNYSGNMVINLNVIGLKNDESLELNTPHKTIFHGKLITTEMNEIFDKCTIALSSLGLHRIGLNEACPLKSREYLGRGIPYVASYIDPDVVEQRFVLKVPAFDDPICIEDVVTFYKEMKDWIDSPEAIRSHALKTVSYSKKMEQFKAVLTK